jgi:hypothetical protein
MVQWQWQAGFSVRGVFMLSSAEMSWRVSQAEDSSFLSLYIYILLL